MASQLIESALALIDDVMAMHGLRFDEAKGEYYYSTENVKRWLTDGAACELCEDNADMGWVDDDSVFEGVFGDVDEPPAHPSCYCSLEYSEKRKRVYV